MENHGRDGRLDTVFSRISALPRISAPLPPPPPPILSLLIGIQGKPVFVVFSVVTLCVNRIMD